MLSVSILRSFAFEYSTYYIKLLNMFNFVRQENTDEEDNYEGKFGISILRKIVNIM